VQVRDAACRVDLRQRRPPTQGPGDRLLDACARRRRQALRSLHDAVQAVVEHRTSRDQLGAVLSNHLGEELLHDVTEDDRVGHLHHRGRQVHREQHVTLSGISDLTRAAREMSQLCTSMSALLANACTIGSSECVASAGASSV